MTKKELVNNLRVREGMTWEQATRVVEDIFVDISDNVAAGETVYVPKFGRFFTTTVAQKRCVHPVTKKDVVMPAHPLVRFRMAEEFRRKLNQ